VLKQIEAIFDVFLLEGGDDARVQEVTELNNGLKILASFHGRKLSVLAFGIYCLLRLN
jgi:hypothetical protein